MLAREVRQRLARLPLFCRLFAEQLAELAGDKGRIDIGEEDPAQALGRMLGAHTGERRLIRGYVPELIDVGFMVRDGRWLRVGARACARAQTSPPDSSEPSTNRERTENEPRTNIEPTSLNDSVKVSHVSEKKASVPAATPPAPPPSPSPSSLPLALSLSLSPTPFSPPSPPVAPAVAGAAVTRAKRKRTADDPAPMPFTVAQVMQALAAGSGGRVVASPFDPRLAPPITTVIRTLAAQRVDLGDVTLVGECYAAGGLPREQISASWVAQTGRLADAIGRARAWRADGRQSPPAAAARAPPVGRTARLEATPHAVFQSLPDDDIDFTPRRSSA